MATRNVLPDTADQIMFGISSLLNDKGLLKAQLQADTAFYFDDNSRIELRNIRVTFHDKAGVRTSVLTAREGTYNTRLQMTEARKNVVVVSEDGRRLTTQQLRYLQGADQISSDSAFVLTEPTRRLEGIGFVSDPDMNNIRVHKVIGGQGGTIPLPGRSP